MTNKKIVTKKESVPAKAAKKSALKTTGSSEKKTTPKLTSKNKEWMYSFFDTLKKCMSMYDKTDDYTFTEFGKNDKVAIAAKKEFDRLLKATKLIFEGMPDKKFKEYAKLLEINEKDLKHFIAREIK